MQKALFHESLVSSDRIIYTPSSFARSTLLYIQEIGSLKATKPHTSSRQNLSSYLFFLVVSGSGELCYNDQTWHLKKGDGIFIDCRLPYSHNTSNDLWQLEWVHFNGSGMSSLYAKYQERGGEPVFRAHDSNALSECLHTLYASAASQDYLRDMKICEGLMHLLTILMEEGWNPEKRKTPGHHQSLLMVREYLDSHYNEQITLNDLASRFYQNKYSLTRLFRVQYGMTIGAYLEHTRISHAKELLRFSDLSVEQIGARIGIRDPNYFSRLFKKVEGISPGEYRKSW